MAKRKSPAQVKKKLEKARKAMGDAAYRRAMNQNMGMESKSRKK